MRAKWWGATALAALALAWGGAGYLATKPTDSHDYRVAAVGAAESAYDALATARLVVDAREQGRVTGPYADSVCDDARDALAGAAKRFAGVSPPDTRAAGLRDALAPLLSRANNALTDIADGRPAAGDDVAAALERFVDEHR